MSAITMDASSPPKEKQHAAFFRQSGWMMIASMIAGGMSWGVHFLSKLITLEQYGEFVTVLMLITVIPTIPLQMIFVQQTARALALGRDRQLARMIRVSWLWMTALWLVAAAVVLTQQATIVERWKLSHPAMLWIALLAMLFSLWSPIFSGALQGRQNFLWLGWLTILGGAGRIIIGATVVIALKGGALGMLAGVTTGIGCVTLLAVWKTRDMWMGKSEPFEGKAMLSQAVPLFLGFGACQMLFTSDMMFAKPHFPEADMAAYGMAGTLSRALLWLVLPLASVMFPKIVHSHAKSEKSNLLGLVLGGTAILAIVGTICLTVLGPWVVKFVGKEIYVVPTVKLLPWYAGAMIPFALANVLANDLLARGRFKIVPALVLIAIAYGVALPYVLNHYPKKLETVLQVLGAFNLLLLAVCAWTAFGKGQGVGSAVQPQ